MYTERLSRLETTEGVSMHVEPYPSITAKPDSFHDLEIPLELEANLQRHREHLSRLVFTLRSAGINREQIEGSISVMVDSYKAELIRTLKEIVR
jgi:hypothetical protein